MADRSVSIRLGTTGKADITRTFDEIGASGDASARRLAGSFERASQDVEVAMHRQANAAAKIAAIVPQSAVQMRINDANSTGFGQYEGSARQSAAAFRELLGVQEQMEERAKRLVAALNPAIQAQQRFDREIGEARTLISAGAISLDDYVAKLRIEQAALDEATGAHNRLAGGSSKMRQAMAGASYQVQDLVTQISMGANPINALVVQGGQLAGQFMHVEGAAGAVARFMMGPWGLAFQVGLMALGPFVAKLWEESDADKAAAKAKNEHRKAVLDLAEAQRQSIVTMERKQALDTAQIKIDLDAAMATRQRVAAELSAARANLQSAQNRVDAGGGDEAAAAGAMFQTRVTQLERERSDNAAAIAGLRQGFEAGFSRMIQQRAEAASTPQGQIDAKYRGLIANAMTELAGVANGPKLRAKLDELYAARERETKAIEKSARVRDQDTVTSSTVAKMLRDSLPGVHVTSTTGGKHVANSYHYRNQAVDFVPAGGVNSMTKADVRSIFESRGINVVELLGPGDKGHSDHFHVAWTKGKQSLDEFNDAAKRAQKAARDAAEAERDLAGDLMDVTRRFDPARAAADEYRIALAKVDALQAGGKLTLSEASGYRLAAMHEEQARRAAEQLKTFKSLFGEGDPLAASIDSYDRDRQVGIDDWNEARDIASAKASVALGELRDFGGQFVDRVLSPDTWSSWGNAGKAVLSDLKSEFLKLALMNPLKNLINGNSALPTLSSAVANIGKLFGGGGAMTAVGTSGLLSGNAAGTEYWSGGMSLVGEDGPEIVSMSRGARVIPAAQTRRMLAGNDNAPAQTNHFHLEGAVVTQDLVDQMNAIGNGAAVRGAAGGAAMAGAENMAMAGRRLGRWR